MRDLSQRLGPVPSSMRAHWTDAGRFTGCDDDDLDITELEHRDGNDLDPFRLGNISYQAKIRKPLDMSQDDLIDFMDLIQSTLRWEPESRPSTDDLLQHKWFRTL